MPEPDSVRDFSMGPGAMGAKLNIQTEAAKQAVNEMTAAMKGLESALQEFGNNAYTLADKINRHLKSIGDTATQVGQQLSGMGSAIGGVSNTGGTTSANAAAASTGTARSVGGAWADKAVSGASSAANAASSAISRVVNKDLAGGISLGSFVGTGGGDGAGGLTKDLALAPLRYLRSRINTNRETALMASGGLSMQAMQQGVGQGTLMSTLGQFPGNIYGTPQDIVGMMGTAPGLGASFSFGGDQSRQGVRAKGFFSGVQQMQMMNPLAQVGGAGGLVDTLGSYAGNTGAQQRSMMLTGGAMGMIATGGRQKSLSEWAESIMRWFEGLRPGKQRGKGFNYGELMAQYFPGSNIDAWFNVNQVPQNMRDYWWTYALAKATKTDDSSSKMAPEQVIQPDQNNVSWQRLRAGSELTRTEFTLAGKMSGQYAEREASNRWFNELTGQLQTTIIPALSKSLLRWIQFLPDSLEDLMMTGAERGMSALLGDVGDADVGDSYGAVGGTGLSGLHPDMKKKVGAMMRANPSIRMTSGLRDTGLQERLRSGGNSNVSGKPSAHTRGMAADLGPRSQYGWIAKNAKRFGLASGKGHGEPWHVGMPGDIPGVGDAFTDFISDISGIGSSAEGMAGFITKMLGFFTGKLGSLLGGAAPASDFASSPDDLYAKLAGATQKTVIGIPTKGGVSVGASQTQSTGGTGSGWAPNGRTWRGTSATGRGDKYNQVASPDIMADIQSSDEVTRGSAVARALHNAGFSGQTLRNFLRISYRESHWTNNAWNSGPLDESGGILQANQLPWTKKGLPAPFTQADAMDPQAAAYIAWDQYRNVSPMNGPGGPNTMMPWNKGGDPLAGIPAGAEALTDQVLKKTNLGDIEAMQAGVNLSRIGGGGPAIAFHNQFSLSIPTYGGSSNGGIDVRRTVTLIADHLEDEMKRRLARTA